MGQANSKWSCQRRTLHFEEAPTVGYTFDNDTLLLNDRLKLSRESLSLMMGPNQYVNISVKSCHAREFGGFNASWLRGISLTGVTSVFL